MPICVAHSHSIRPLLKRCTDLSKHLSGEFDIDNLDLIITLIESALDVNIMKI